MANKTNDFFPQRPESKTITLSCGKLTTGVTVKPWTGIFMIRNLKSPETYFQSAFRVQSPWEVRSEGDNIKSIIVKQECYVFDFALNRALKQISDYARNLNADGGNPENKVAEFIKFLPVLAYDGSSMRQVVAGEGVGLYSTVLSRADYDSLSGKSGGRLAADKEPPYTPSR